MRSIQQLNVDIDRLARSNNKLFCVVQKLQQEIENGGDRFGIEDNTSDEFRSFESTNDFYKSYENGSYLTEIEERPSGFEIDTYWNSENERSNFRVSSSYIRTRTYDSAGNFSEVRTLVDNDEALVRLTGNRIELNKLGGDPYNYSSSNPTQVLFLDSDGFISVGNSEFVDLTSDQTIGGVKTFASNLLAATTGLNIGSSSIGFNQIWTSTIGSSSNLFIGAATNSGILFNSTATSSSRIGGFFPTTKNFFLQAAGSLPTDSGHRLQVHGTSIFNDEVSINANVLSLGGNRSLGSPSNAWNNTFTSNVFSATSSSLRIGGASTQLIGFQNTNLFSNENLVAGFLPTSRNFFIQETGEVPTDSGHKLQVYGTTLLYGEVDLYGSLIPTSETSDLGNSTERWKNLFVNNIFSNTTLRFGTAASEVIAIQQSNGVGNDIVGGFFTSNRNFFLQPAGAVPSDSGHRLQVTGSARITESVVHVVEILGTTLSVPSVTIGNGQAYRVILNTNGTISIPNQSSTSYRRLTIKVEQDTTGERTLTWLGEIKFPGGIAPTTTPAANSQDVYVFEWIDNAWNLTSHALNVKTL